jgi:hypothetical protein
MEQRLLCGADELPLGAAYGVLIEEFLSKPDYI